MTNRFTMPKGSLIDAKTMKVLFTLCWLAYVCTYLGRLNYSACLIEIVAAEGWTKGQAGLIATGFFTTYGLGQLVNGYIGDKLSPKVMVSFGLGCSGLINLLFPFMNSLSMIMILWCMNGFVQSMIWSPLIRLLSEWLPTEKRLKACVNMNGTVPVGTLAVYGLSAVLVYLGNWHLVFYTSGTILIIMSLVFFKGVTNVEKDVVGKKDESTITATYIKPIEQQPFMKLFFLGAIPLCCIALFTQGMLKDGVTTWIPTFLGENFGLTSAVAILTTTIVPIINLGGVYFASYMNGKYFKNEVLTATTFFCVGLVALLLLTFVKVDSVVIALLLLATTTTFMMGINTLFASMMPSYYVKFGICSTVTGILNSAAYAGCAVSSYGNGVIIENFGWNTIMYCWCVSAVIGIVACMLAIKPWKSFRAYAKK